MNDLDWQPPFARIWPESDASVSGRLKLEPEDFCVQEIPAFEFSGQGEHLYLFVEKRGQNTAWVASQLANHFGLQSRDVGYAGLKDRHAVTRQWFSLPVADDAAAETVQIEAVQILGRARHSRKLRRGDLSGNAFEICIRDIQGPVELIEQRLDLLARQGFPNFFGPQRFGRNGDNVAQALDLNRRRRLVRHGDKGIYLSAARSWLFNRFLADRIESGDWPEISELQDLTGPLWGRGRPAPDAHYAAAESQLPQRYPELVDLLEHAGLGQERRLLRIQVPLQWSFGEEVMRLSFCLPAGCYATALIDQLMVARQSPEGSA